MMRTRIDLRYDEKRHIRTIQTFPKNRSGKKLCIYSHFDRDHIIDSYVVFALKSMRALEYEIVFVSTSEKLSYSERYKIRGYVSTLIVKKNIGYDFMSWKTGLYAAGDYTRYQQIVHMNDSIFFPLFDPRKMFAQMKERRADFWGLLDSYNIQYHVQSYFWVFEKNIVSSRFYHDFWNNCQVIHSKQALIDSYELQCAKQAAKAGFNVGSFVSFTQVYSTLRDNLDERERRLFAQVNPAYYFWDIMIETFHAPFLKKNILLKTHSDYNPDTYEWDEVLRKYCRYDSSLIDRYIRRMSGDIKPAFLDHAEVGPFIESIRKLKHYNRLVIYGYGQVARLVHSVSNNITGAVDNNALNANVLNRLYGIDMEVRSVSELKTMSYDKIVICSIGYENEAIAKLRSLGVKDEDIILLSKISDKGMQLVYALRTAIRLYYIEARKDREIKLSSCDAEFIEYVRTFLAFLGLHPNFIRSDSVFISSSAPVFKAEVFVKHR